LKKLQNEVLATLSSMQRGKSPRPDGLTMEFYVGFYDLIKDDLLKVVQESQRAKKNLEFI
jgi:hypothetical protein